MSNPSEYNRQFYKDRDKRTRYSAEKIAAIVMELVNPASVADVGCGVGTWLETFKKLGVESVLGIEGDWVDDDVLVLDKSEIQHWDLTKPLRMDKHFDLVMSLEVAEHLEEKYAGQFVESLTSLAPVILFSAAVPLQGGVKHLNEQWPSYWKAHFEDRGYIWIDAIRPEVWDDQNVEIWYAQNSCIYVRKDVLGEYPKLKELEGRNIHMIKWFKNRLGRLI